MEEKKYSEHQKCPSCMIGKSQLNDYLDSTTRVDLPLKKVYFDLISSKIISIEGYSYAAISPMIVQNSGGSTV